MSDKITEWTFSVDRDKLKEKFQFESGIIISRKSNTDDFFRHIIEKLPSLAEGGIVSKEVADRISIDRGLEIPLSCSIELEQHNIDRYFEKVEDEFSSDIKRKCYNCQKEIDYGDFCRTNRTTTPGEVLENVWKSPYVELYCCTCFRKGVYLDKMIKKRERLLNKAYRLNEKFGFLTD